MNELMDQMEVSFWSASHLEKTKQNISPSNETALPGLEHAVRGGETGHILWILLLLQKIETSKKMKEDGRNYSTVFREF